MSQVIQQNQPASPGPTPDSERITSLDLIRGIAVLGILLMNVVSLGLGDAPYLNISAGGSETWLDWGIGIFGEIFVDQKFMGLFSLLFGASVVLFADRAELKGSRPALLSLWRNGLLLAIGIAHMVAWQGDVLTAYALASPIIIALRKLPPKLLMSLGAVVVLLTVGLDLWMQSLVNSSQLPVESFWVANGDASGDSSGDAAYLGILFNYFARAVGMMLIGVGLYRTGIVEGRKSTRYYRNIAIAGLGIGLMLALCGVLLLEVNDYSPEVAFLSFIPNTLGTIPATLGYMSLIILWDKSRESRLKAKLRAVGRMALTNYLMHTVLGLLVLNLVLQSVDLTRSILLLFVIAVWALQLLWSDAWLSRFRFGPFEWLWRVATYRRGQVFRRT